jgi:hypothetical protein
VQTLRPRSSLSLAAASLLLAPALGAQSNACPGGPPISAAQISQDACQKALDLFAFMAPQLGASIAGGNLVLGSAGPLGGLGRFSVGLRANVIRGQLPQTDGVTLSPTGRQASDFRPSSQVIGLPGAEAAIGLFRGIPIGVTNVLGVDALASAFFVPDVEADDFSLTTTGSSVRFGYGVRIGILQETLLVPAVSVAVMRRELPTVNLRARVGTADSVRVDGLEASATSWRVAVGKRVALLGLSAGAGQDRYDASASAAAFIASRTVGGLQFPAFVGSLARAEQELTRTNVFGGVSLNFPFLRLSGEIGRVTGGDVAPTFNTFGGRRPNDAYTYGSVGLRFQL